MHEAKQHLVHVELTGGPAEMVRSGALTERRIKLPRLGGYEHFELTDAPDPASPAAFAWTMRTKPAE